MTRHARQRLGTLLVTACSTAATALAAPAPLPPPANPEPGWHIIRPGDTLEGLAQKYLGDTRHWPEIHRLNAGIDDPHWIYPGRRIRVVLERPSAAPNAQVTELARRVEAQPQPVPWRPADKGDLLLERDGLRTFTKASAQLLFDDGTTATVSQESLVFIRRQTPARSAKPAKEIEVVLGQTDIETKRQGSLPPPEIEVVVAGAKSRSEAGSDGTVRNRSRRTGDSAQFMQFEGKARVAAGGGTVDLAAGTGSVVAPAARPSPAEALLAAPRALEPEEGGELGRDEPLLRWEPVAGAASYVVEVCADAGCGSVREKLAGRATVEATLAEPLADGVSFWRVNAVAPSGLDGFPSAPRRFVAVDSARPPAPTVALLDASGAPLAGELATLIVPRPPALDVRAVDARGRPLDWRLLVDGVETSPAAFAALVGTGRHEVVAVARDERGREASSQPLVFELDVASPLVEAPSAEGVPAPDEREAKRSRKRRAADAPAGSPCDAGLEVWDGAASWVAVACGAAGSAPTVVPLTGLAADLRLRSTRPLYVGERRFVPGGAEAALRASDLGSGLAEARLLIVPSPHLKGAGRLLLEVEVVDRAGRSSSASWHLEPR